MSKDAIPNLPKNGAAMESLTVKASGQHREGFAVAVCILPRQHRTSDVRYNSQSTFQAPIVSGKIARIQSLNPQRPMSADKIALVRAYLLNQPQ
jgi:hypothetical protein